MGGNVVLSCTGELRLVYRSQMNLDRPSAAFLLEHCHV